MALEVTLSYTPVVNFAMQQNHAPVLREIRLLNASENAVRDLDICLAFEPAFAYAYTAHLETIAPGCEECISPLPVVFSTAFLSNLTERVEGVIRLTVRTGDEELAQKLSSMNPKKLRLASPSIDGPLYGFFEVQDSIVPIVKEQEYGDSGDTCLYVRTTIKKIKAGKLTIPKYDDGSPRYYVDFYLLFLNSDGATIYKSESYYGARFPDLEEMNVGDVTTVEFRLDENYKSGLYKYRIISDY